MNREEINEALKLIKEPITVNSIEYKYFDQENYEKLLSVYENCRWFVDNYEQVLQNIENLQQELQRKDNNWNELKEWLEMQCNFVVQLPTATREIAVEHNTMKICYENVLDKIKELESK